MTLDIDDAQTDYAPEGSIPGFRWLESGDWTAKAAAYGITPSYFGQVPLEIYDDLPDGAELRRYQCMKQYKYDTGPPGETEIAPIQLRIVIYTIGGISYELKEHFKDVDLHRVATAYNSAPPAEYEGYLAGFFTERSIHDEIDEEDRQVAVTDANILGVPQYYIEVYDQEHNVRGVSSGFFDPFQIRQIQPIPQHEEWGVTRNYSRNSYEIWPTGNTARLQGTDKQVYVNGRYIGNFRPQRGTVELKRAYQTKDLTWKDSTTGKQMWSRKKFIDETDMHYNEIVDGGLVYKVGETADRIDLVTSRDRTPEHFDPVDPIEIDRDLDEPEDDLVLADADDEPTDFRVHNDIAIRSALGYYATPADREITRLTTPADLIP